jgi:NAD dependent epimerase/dehydratase family enzyme
LPWIHVGDLASLLVHLVDHGHDGPVLGTAPEPVRQADYARTLGRVLHRPAIAPAPAPLLRLALGRMADELMLASQRTRPDATLATGFRFAHPSLEPALRDLITP